MLSRRAVAASLLSALVAGCSLVPPSDHADVYDGPEGIETSCWGDIAEQECLLEARDVLDHYRLLHPGTEVVSIEIDHDRGNHVCIPKETRADVVRLQCDRVE